MGITNHTFKLIEKHIEGVKWVAELGDQNYYGNDVLPYGDYFKKWYEEKGISYIGFDLNGNNGVVVHDFAKPLPQEYRGIADMVTDGGFSEHVGSTVDDYYQCWLNKWDLCKLGGVIVSENPKTNNWPDHSPHFLGDEFYDMLKHYGIKVLESGIHAAMANYESGWNVWGVIRKDQTDFIPLNQFKTLPIFKK